MTDWSLIDCHQKNYNTFVKNNQQLDINKRDNMEKIKLPEPVFYPLFRVRFSEWTTYDAAESRTINLDGCVSGIFNGTLAAGSCLTLSGNKVEGYLNLKDEKGRLVIAELKGTAGDNAFPDSLGSGIRANVTFFSAAGKYRYLRYSVAVAKTEVNGELALYGMLAKAPAGLAPADVSIEKLYYVEVFCDPPSPAGRSEGSMRLMIPITGGSFEGEGISGTVQSCGADWNCANIGALMKSHVRTKYVLKTSDDKVILQNTDGRAVFRYSDLIKVLRGNAKAPFSYFFRQHIYLSSDPKAFPGLQDRTVFAVVGASLAGGIKICYQAYMLSDK